ncbi:aldo/keto reductase [Kribbella capetownensis]|uniref:Aldo/keto reductase n=1 Tax=Kribbella capetownensis TaxID=1572659 RepID=A0A4R0K0S8_9ACTN|nr:aldo/keto reductase [Kribbella capetownensis]
MPGIDLIREVPEESHAREFMSIVLVDFQTVSWSGQAGCSPTPASDSVLRVVGASRIPCWTVRRDREQDAGDVPRRFGGPDDEGSTAFARRRWTGGQCARDGVLGDRRACDESLRRLGTDHIDLYQFHLGGYDLAKADDVLAVFEELVAAGKVRAHFNVFGGNAEVLELCEQHGLASIVRGPLGMGLLTGKFDQNSTLPADDVRHGWNFRTGDQAESLRRLDAIRDVLTSDGRTLAQGALAWPWARSEAFIPIPGFKTVAQVEENAGALDHGPLTKTELAEVTTILQ